MKETISHYIYDCKIYEKDSNMLEKIVERESTSNKSIRSSIFNFNKIVTHLNIDSNIPDS